MWQSFFEFRAPCGDHRGRRSEIKKESEQNIMAFYACIPMDDHKNRLTLATVTFRYREKDFMDHRICIFRNAACTCAKLLLPPDILVWPAMNNKISFFCCSQYTAVFLYGIPRITSHAETPSLVYLVMSGSEGCAIFTLRAGAVARRHRFIIVVCVFSRWLQLGYHRYTVTTLAH